MHLTNNYDSQKPPRNIPQQPANAWLTHNTLTHTFTLHIDTEDGKRRRLLLTQPEAEQLCATLLELLETDESLIS